MDPATRAAWEDRRDGLGLAETVRFTGEVTDDELGLAAAALGRALARIEELQ